MTEAEWLACADPQKMFEFLRGKASDRKWRLLACACCRRIWHLLLDESSHRAVVVAEVFADGLKTRSELLESWADAEVAVDPWASDQEAQDNPSWRETRMESEPGYLVACASDPDVAFAGVYEIIRLSPGGERHHQAMLFRDIFGNPFRPSPPLPSAVLAWNDGTVPRLAQAIYEDRKMPEGTLDTARLAILADALLDAGCEDEALIQHCREPGVHVRGCWALDIILGKQ
jgi:hypothetical protein